MGLSVAHSGSHFLRDGWFNRNQLLTSGQSTKGQSTCGQPICGTRVRGPFAGVRGCRWRGPKESSLPSAGIGARYATLHPHVLGLHPPRETASLTPAAQARTAPASARPDNTVRRPVAHTCALRGGSSSGSSDGSRRSKAEGTRPDNKPQGEASASAPAPASAASAAVAASSVAAAAVVGAVAVAAVPPPPPRTSALRLLQRVVGLLRSHFVAVLLLYAVKDGAAFLLHRVAQRLTNHAAEVLLGIPTSTSGNPWWLYLDAAFFRANPGYEVLVGLGFLACLPLNIALNSAAFTTAALVCTPSEVREELAAAATAAGVSPSASASASSGEGSSSGGAPGARSPHRGGRGRRGVGGALQLPTDDPAAAALADLGIHALPTPPPPSEVPAAPPPPPPPPLAPEDPVPASASTYAAAATVGGTVGQGSGGGEGAGTEASSNTNEPGGGPLSALRAALGSIAAVLPEAASMLRRVWWVDLHFTARALPLQGLCLLVFPALWALPRLMRIQLALPAAVLEGRTGTDALHRSAGLMTSSLASYGVPFAVLLAAGRLLEYVQTVAMALVPPRWWREVVEVPLAIAGAFLLFKAAVHRLQDLLPLATFLELQQQEAQAAAKHRQQVLQEQVLPQPDPQRQQEPGEEGQRHRRASESDVSGAQPKATAQNGAARSPMAAATTGQAGAGAGAGTGAQAA